MQGAQEGGKRVQEETSAALSRGRQKAAQLAEALKASAGETAGRGSVRRRQIASDLGRAMEKLAGGGGHEEGA